MNTVTLYRPVGLKELELIINNNYNDFPPRLEWQPIFYPVLNQTYAEQIAITWNTEDAFSGYCGIVTKFALSENHFIKYPVQNVGGENHDELWIPADELSLFNKHIVGFINIVSAFFGEHFIMPESHALREILFTFHKIAKH